MASLYNLARVYSATTGSGSPIVLGAAVPGFLTFTQARVPNGDSVTYVISNKIDTEIGRGTYTASGTTLSRDVILDSTNSGNPISLDGTEIVFITAAAQDIPKSGIATLSFGAAPGTNTATATITGLPNITSADASIRVWLMGTDSTATHNAFEHFFLSNYVGLAVASITDGAGFTIQAITELRLTGDIKVRWAWTN
jgi:hypothetical protein